MSPPFQPSLVPDERQILHEQGAYTSGRTWKLGQFCLTDRRLLFGHLHRQFLDIDLRCIEDVRVQKKAFLLANKPCIVLNYRDSASGRVREAWILNGHMDRWWGAVASLLAERGLKGAQPLVLSPSALSTAEGSKGERSSNAARGSTGSPRAACSALEGSARAAQAALRMGRRHGGQARRERLQAALAELHGQNKPGRLQAKDIAEVARLVDGGSAAMLWHFWKNRHYKLDELKAMLAETSHMAVLTRIREVINPAAVDVLGKPILVFERSRMDYQTGEHVLHSWWLNEQPMGDVGNTDQFVDVLDEGDHFLVLLELAGAREQDIRVEAGDGRLSVTVDSGEGRYYQETPLPAGADARHLSTTYRNGILQVRLGKEAA